MKNIIIIITCFFLFSSCDKRKDFYADMNKAPLLTIDSYATQSYVTEINDSIKQKHPQYPITVQLKDEEQLSYTATSNIPGDKFVINDQYNILFTPDTVHPYYGKHILSFIATDGFHRQGIAHATLTLFDNLPPVADVYTVKIGSNDPLEYMINAHKSYDGDSRFFGKVINYRYKIGSYEVETDNPAIYYIFPDAGNYSITVSAEDDNGVWSAPKTINVTVN